MWHNRTKLEAGAAREGVSGILVVLTLEGDRTELAAGLALLELASPRLAAEAVTASDVAPTF